jgi:hypothetical protein
MSLVALNRLFRQAILSGVIVAGLGACSGSGDGGSTITEPPTDVQEPPPSAGCLANANPVFTRHITDLSLIKSIVPTGNIGAADEIVGRTYMHVVDAVRTAGTPVPVYAPTDMSLIRMAYYDPSGQAGYPPDYAMTFQVSCEVVVIFAHLKEVVPKIQAVAPATPSPSSAQFAVNARVDFEAGERIGSFFQAPVSWDFVVENPARPNQYVNQGRYEADQNNNALYQVCGAAYFEPGLRAEYYALFGSYNGSVAGVEDCRGTSRDVAGTLSGTWFLDENGSDGTALVDQGDYRYRIDIAMELDGEIKIGGAGPGLRRVYEGNLTHRDPVEITGTHCYQMEPRPQEGEGFVFVEVLAGDRLRVAYRAQGLCPTSFPEGGTSATYYR